MNHGGHSSPSIKETGKKKGLRANVTLNVMERVMGIEPTLSAWEAADENGRNPISKARRSQESNGIVVDKGTP